MKTLIFLILLILGLSMPIYAKSAKVLSVTGTDEQFNLKVEYKDDDGTIIITDVAVHLPPNYAYIQAAIDNRGRQVLQSKKAKIEADTNVGLTTTFN